MLYNAGYLRAHGIKTQMDLTHFEYELGKRGTRAGKPAFEAIWVSLMQHRWLCGIKLTAKWASRVHRWVARWS